jgi:hypothetical protein
MAGKKPSFITGATAKIKLGGLTMAYAQDVAYTVTTTTIPIETMGRYEVVSNEPVAYFVEGSLSVIRYTSVAKANNMSGAAQGGNGAGNWNLADSNVTQQGKGSDHINPAALLASKTFDVEVFQKQQTGINATTGQPDITTVSVDKIRDCRLTRKGAGVNKRGVLTDNYAFVGILSDGDTFTAGESGDIDLSS